eukprot:4513110-Alexandrium_andersonii.AAC.1
MDCPDGARCATANCVYQHPPGYMPIGIAAESVRRRQAEVRALRARDAARNAAQHRREVQAARAALAEFWPGD